MNASVVNKLVALTSKFINLIFITTLTETACHNSKHTHINTVIRLVINLAISRSRLPPGRLGSDAI